jgi:hypothetical protein
MIPLFLSLIFLFFKIEYDLNLFYILIPLITLHIYIFFIKSFKEYRIAFSLSMALMGFIMQSLSVWGTFQDYYSNETAYYLIGFFIIFYILLSFDLKKASQIATHRSDYLTKLIHKVKVNKEGIYYVDDEKSTLSGKDDIPNGEMNLTSFYTFIIVTIIALPLVILGKITIAIGIFSSRYFPDSNFIFFYAMFILGVLFFLMGLAVFLTYLKLDLSEDEEKK